MTKYKERENGQLLIRIPDDLKLKFKIYALQKGVTVSALIRDYMERCVKRADL